MAVSKAFPTPCVHVNRAEALMFAAIYCTVAHPRSLLVSSTTEIADYSSFDKLHAPTEIAGPLTAAK
jgi:hypothetical protein